MDVSKAVTNDYRRWVRPHIHDSHRLRYLSQGLSNFIHVDRRETTRSYLRMKKSPYRNTLCCHSGKRFSATGLRHRYMLGGWSKGIGHRPRTYRDKDGSY